MEEFKFNSESSYKSTGERNQAKPVTLSFKNEPAVFATEKKSKKRSRAFKTLLSLVAVVAIAFASGAAGAYIVSSNMPQPEVTITPSQITDAIGQTVVITSSADSTRYATVAAKAKPTVVEITTEMATGGSYFQQYIKSGAGSGVIITSDGYIITNNHVIDGATKITVRLSSGVEYPATLIGADAQSDIAVIKIEEIALPHATIGNSSAHAVGEEVLAIGNPLGTLGGSVTNGIISALGREITVDGQKMTLLQTNAAINPGNSGGGLFNMNGELVAIVNAKSSGESIEGLGFAIPINDAYSIAQALMENGYVLGRPALGISYIAINDYMDLWRYGVSSYGIYVYDGGETGLENGDRIVRIGDYEVADTATLKSAIQNYKVGDTVNITVVRRGRYADVSVTLIENKPAETKIELQANN